MGIETELTKTMTELRDQNLVRMKAIEEKNDTLPKIIEERMAAFKEQFDVKIAEILKKQKKSNLTLPGVDEEKEKFSFRKAYIAMADNDWSKAGYEKEVFQNTQKVMDTATGAAGAFTIPEEISSTVIDLAIAMMPIMNMGVTRLTGLSGDLSIPKITTRPTSASVAENATPATSDVALDERKLRPKRIAVYTKVSKRLLRQSSAVIEQIVKNELAKANALKMHRLLIDGSGAGDEPKGIVNFGGLTSTAALATNGARFTIDNAAEMAMNIDNADLLKDTGSYGWLLSPRVKWGLKRERVAQFSGQTEGIPVIVNAPIMSDQQLESTLGWMVRSTTDLPRTLTKGSSNTVSNVIFGDWSQVWIGEWLGMELKVSDIASDSTNSAFLTDQVWLLIQHEFDMTIADEAGLTLISDAEDDPTLW